MNLDNFLKKINDAPEQTQFDEVISLIDSHYVFTPTAFSNGELNNAANQNNGSCKIFAFAKLHQLPEDITLQCFGDYYRLDVLQHPDGEDHMNIRNFMRTGWSGIRFEQDALIAR